MKHVKKLLLNKETLRDLTGTQLNDVVGGEGTGYETTTWTTSPEFFSCAECPSLHVSCPQVEYTGW